MKPMENAEHRVRETQDPSEEIDPDAAVARAARVFEYQTLADSDQSLSEGDQSLAERDQASSERDQIAADGERAALDRELRNLGSENNPPSPADVLISNVQRESARAVRRSTAEDRLRTSELREHGADLRDEDSSRRDEVAAAEDRHTKSELVQYGSSSTATHSALEDLAALRIEAAEVRRSAAEGRKLAAEARKKFAQRRSAALSRLRDATAGNRQALGRDVGDVALEMELAQALADGDGYSLITVHATTADETVDEQLSSDAIAHVLESLHRDLDRYVPIVRDGSDRITMLSRGIHADEVLDVCRTAASQAQADVPGTIASVGHVSGSPPDETVAILRERLSDPD